MTQVIGRTMTEEEDKNKHKEHKPKRGGRIATAREPNAGELKEVLDTYGKKDSNGKKIVTGKLLSIYL